MSNPHSSLLSMLGAKAKSGRTIIAGFTLGFVLCMCAIFSLFFLHSLIGSSDSSWQIVVPKTGLADMVRAGNSGIPSETIDELENISGVQVFPVLAQSYSSTVQAELRGYGLRSEIFLESLPSSEDLAEEISANQSFVWEKPESLSSAADSEPVPILLGREFLLLFNMSYGAMKGFPPISESILPMIPLRMSIYGPRGHANLRARIIGTTSTINTFLVPHSFQEWANNSIGDGQPAPHRLLLQCQNPADPTLTQLLQDKRLEQAGSEIPFRKLLSRLQVLPGALLLLTLIILALSLLFLDMHLQWTLLQNTHGLFVCSLIGYPEKEIARIMLRRWNKMFLFAAILTSSILLILASAASTIFSTAWPLWTTLSLVSFSFIFNLACSKSFGRRLRAFISA